MEKGCTVTKIYFSKGIIPWLLEEVGGAVPELARDDGRVDEADWEREQDPARHRHQQQQLPSLEPTTGGGHWLNELDLQSFFGLCVQLCCTHWLRDPATPPISPHLGSYTRALLISKIDDISL
jgi:hypothetical protein